MAYQIEYYSAAVQEAVLGLPPTLRARFFSLADRMAQFGPNLGPPHSES